MILHGLAPNFKRSKAIFQINALIIIKMNIFSDQILNFHACGKFHTIKTFYF